MKLEVTLGPTANQDWRTVIGTARLDEYLGDEESHPLVGEETLRRVLDAWVDADPAWRGYIFVDGPDPDRVSDDRHVVIARCGTVEGKPRMILHDVAPDDTTGLYPIDLIAARLPYRQIDWDLTLIEFEHQPEPYVPRVVDTSIYAGHDLDEHSELL